jgi:hypothetical protein
MYLGTVELTGTFAEQALLEIKVPSEQSKPGGLGNKHPSRTGPLTTKTFKVMSFDSKVLDDFLGGMNLGMRGFDLRRGKEQTIRIAGQRLPAIPLNVQPHKGAVAEMIPAATGYAVLERANDNLRRVHFCWSPDGSAYCTFVLEELLRNGPPGWSPKTVRVSTRLRAAFAGCTTDGNLIFDCEDGSMGAFVDVRYAIADKSDEDLLRFCLLRDFSKRFSVSSENATVPIAKRALSGLRVHLADRAPSHMPRAEGYALAVRSEPSAKLILCIAPLTSKLDKACFAKLEYLSAYGFPELPTAKDEQP